MNDSINKLWKEKQNLRAMTTLTPAEQLHDKTWWRWSGWRTIDTILTSHCDHGWYACRRTQCAFVHETIHALATRRSSLCSCLRNPRIRPTTHRTTTHPHGRVPRNPSYSEKSTWRSKISSITFDRTLAGRSGRHGGRRHGGRVYLGTNGSKGDSAIVKGERARRCWLWTSNNACVAAEEVQRRRGGECRCKAKGRSGGVKENWTGRTDLVGLRCRSPTVVRTPATHPQFISTLQEKARPDRRANRYRTALYGFRGPDRGVQTYAGGLRIGVGDALRKSVIVVMNLFSVFVCWKQSQT